MSINAVTVPDSIGCTAYEAIAEFAARLAKHGDSIPPAALQKNPSHCATPSTVISVSAKPGGVVNSMLLDCSNACATGPLKRLPDSKKLSSPTSPPGGARLHSKNWLLAQFRGTNWPPHRHAGNRHSRTIFSFTTPPHYFTLAAGWVAEADFSLQR